MGKVRRIRPRGRHLLWSSTQTAKEEYRCNTPNCAYYYIDPLEEYTREVWVCGAHMWVERHHLYCPELYDPDDDKNEMPWRETKDEAATGAA